MSLNFHHVGVARQDLDRETRRFAKTNLLRVSEGYDGLLGEGRTDNEHNGS